MYKKIQQMRWELYSYKQKRLLLYGLKNGLILPYDDKLIEKLREIYYGGIPASIILLSNAMTNGHCYDRALLLSRAFLDEEDDINLLYATIDSIKLNPRFISDSPYYADHCVLERITKDGRHYIYDTSAGFVYDKNFYWIIEHPKVRKVNGKESIKAFISHDEGFITKYDDRFIAPLIIPSIEKTYGMPSEIYSQAGIELLQREIEHYKSTIDYNGLIEKINQDLQHQDTIKKLKLAKRISDIVGGNI